MRRTIVFLFLLAGAMSASGRDSVDHWFEVRSQNFVVLTDSNEKQGLRVASQFERMRAVFHILMPTASDSAGSPIIVLALKDKKAMQTLEPESYLAKGQVNLAGFFMRAPDKNYILLRLDAEGAHPFATVYHEYTHYLMRDAGGWLPLWLNEGMAEFFQNTDIRDKEVLLGQANDDDILYLRQNPLMPLTTLFKVDYSSPYYHEEHKGSVFYAESWALTHMLTISDAQKGTSRLQDYANLLVRKQDPVTAAQQAFGDLNQLQKSLNIYISQLSFMMFKMNKAVPVNESTFQVRAIPATDADAIRADVLVYNQRTRDAQVLIDQVLQEDPNNALAHETMGFLKFREGDKEAAKKWYGEAVKLDSQSYLAHYYYAVMSMGADGEGKDPVIESSLRSCIKLNPNFAPAYDALARYYMRDPAKTTEAHILNIRAITLEPDNLYYRLNAAVVLLTNQRYDDAMAALKAARRVAKTPQDIASVQARIAQVEQYQASVAQGRQAESQPGTPSVTTVVTDTPTITSSDGSKMVLKANSPEDSPRYPTEAPTGPHHVARGLLRKVQCGYPSILTLSVEQPGRAPAVLLYRNDFRQIEFSATNFTPKGDINPCKDIEGLKGKVEYTEVSDKSVAGQILSVELTK